MKITISKEAEENCLRDWDIDPAIRAHLHGHYGNPSSFQLRHGTLTIHSENDELQVGFKPK